MWTIFLWSTLCIGLKLCAPPPPTYLSPPHFNLAEEKNITATATCGEGVPEPEMFCKLVGAIWLDSSHVEGQVVDGQACDYCFDKEPKLNHKIEYAIDGTERYWQSPPLSRGLNYDKINITIDLGQEFHVAYVYMKMGNSPRPDVWVLERSKDGGKTYTPWQYFASSKEECIKRFGHQTVYPITRDDSVVCETKFSKLVPLEGGEIVVSLMNDRPHAENFSLSEVLQDWTRATNIRLRLLKTKTTLGSKSAASKHDPTVTRRYFYSIKEINVGGRCVCNGHANTCDVKYENLPRTLFCDCQHNTCGKQCEECCPGFVQKKWKPATVNNPNECEECNCFEHSSECVYNETVDQLKLSLDKFGQYSGGGVCLNCQHNTEGINCNKCKPKFYRPTNRPLNDENVCEPCQCDEQFSTGLCDDGSGRCQCKKQFLPPNCDRCSTGYYGYPNCFECDCFVNGTIDGSCEIHGGQCPCKRGYTGKYCRQCEENYFGFPDCKPCECASKTSVNNKCDVDSGNCTCRYSYAGRRCDKCEIGFFNYPSCTVCDCERTGTVKEICSASSGKCICKPGFGGDRCDQCAIGFYGFPNCTACECDPNGSNGFGCHPTTGRCSCIRKFGGKKCDKCAPGFFNYPECNSCRCDNSGSKGITCDDNGQCNCKDNFDGEKCNKCKKNFYNYPLCEQCNCNPAGVLPTFGGCGSLTTGELCECKSRVTGRQCHLCKDLYWNLKRYNSLGCQPCNCNLTGTVSALESCNGVTGQCICKQNVKSQKCNECVDGTYALSDGNHFGCRECACNIGGAINNNCNKTNGNCNCKPRITGRQCNKVAKTHYFPTLYQHQYELEDGFTPSETPARFNYKDENFPNFSWKGYANFSEIQREVILNIAIEKERLFLPIYRYVNANPKPVNAKLMFTADFDDEPQVISFTFEPSEEPKLFLITAKAGVGIPPLVLSPGKWKASLKVEGDVLVDYMVLIPQNYYEATILRDSASKACKMYDAPHLCRQYAYPKFPKTAVIMKAETGNFVGDSELLPSQKYEDFDATILGLNSDDKMAKMNKDQPNIRLKSKVTPNEPYVVVVTYTNPEYVEKENEEAIYMEVEVPEGDNFTQTGKIVLTQCPYSFACQQVVKTESGAVSVFTFNSSEIEFNLKFDLSNASRSMDDVALFEVALIPRNEWSMDYVIPKLVCAMKNSKCIESSFVANPEAIKIEVEKSLRTEDTAEKPFKEVEGEGISRPILIYGNEGSSITVEGSVSKSGLYTFVVHYYQSNTPSFDIEVNVQNTEGIIPIKHCPNKMGCRSVLHEKETNSTAFNILQDFSLIMKNPNDRTAGLDYILIVPAELYSQDILQLQTPEIATDFIKQCGQNSFYMPTNVSEFCRESVFALTVDYNNMALPCKCVRDGSKTFECEEFGGQCKCKDNIIGRTCNSCKIGYYGFPNCKKCDCPTSAICHEISGQCICPPRVTGQKCDQCRENTYGFHSLLGCQECNCNIRGSESKQCDLISGNCTCKNNIVGRTCNTCKRGYASFPYCTLCDCDISGTTEEICNKDTRQCYCKKNVYGDECDKCQPGSYFLEESNPFGCTKCFCFTATDRCISSSLSVVPIKDMTNEEWAVVKLHFDTSAIKEATVEDSIKVNLVHNQVRAVFTGSTRGDNPSETMNTTGLYFAVPSTYLGKRITSYGLNISYLIQDIVDVSEVDDAIITPDLVLVGSNITVIHESIEQPADHSMAFPFNYSITEKTFKRLDGSKLTREQMMLLLVNLQHIYIRGSYFKPANEIHLMDFVLESTSERFIPGSRLALSVEKCVCPKSYTGTSCEQCARGYYRAKTGPYLGYCIPCQCHGHTDECDVETGICLNCKNNTVGDHCEKCAPGYHGDATKGSPHDCLICACPLPIESNNFATSCEIREDRVGNSISQQISCTCKEGYYGATCNVCASGFYGRPTKPGEYCKPCKCNGNIDTSQIGSCDSETGLCTKCLHNTAGAACEICRPWFQGNALTQNCKSCKCDKIGSEKCDHETGLCKCLPNVVGETCNQCAPYHWDFNSRKGCTPCNCDIASVNTSCDVMNGQCYCRPGVTGATCNVCKPGYWKYSAQGCESCNCAEKYSEGTGCDQLTGQCKCLPGVIGEKCDSCPPRWVFIKNKECKKCDSCVHFLLDDTDQLPELIDPTLVELRLASASVYALRKLTHLNKTIEQYKYNITELTDNPNPFDLESIEELLKSAETHAEKNHNSAEYNLKHSEKEASSAMNVSGNSVIVQKEVDDAVSKLNDVINELKKLESGFIHPSVASDLESKTMEAELILAAMNRTSFDEHSDSAENEKNATSDLLNRVVEFKNPTIVSKNNISDTEDSLQKVRDAVKDLDDKIQNALQTSFKAENIHQDTTKQFLGNVKPMVKDTTDSDVSARKAISDAVDLIDKSKAMSSSNRMYDLSHKAEKLKPESDKLEEVKGSTQETINELKPLVANASKHAENLQDRRKQLEKAVESYRNVSKMPIEAANRYQTILSEIANASSSAADAKKASEEAKQLVDGESDKALSSKIRSHELKKDALNLQIQVENKLDVPLNASAENVTKLEDALQNSMKSHEYIKQELEDLSSKGVTTQSGKAVDMSNDTSLKANKTLTEINDILERIEKARTKSRKVPTEYDDVVDSIRNANSYKDRVHQILPEITRVADNVLKKNETLNALSNKTNVDIEELKKKIAYARGLANRIEVGGEFSRNSYLQLRNPDNLEDLGANFKLSMFFKTKDPRGFLAYIGNPVKVQSSNANLRNKRFIVVDSNMITPSTDFMALEIQNGKLVLTMDLGSGAQFIKNEKFVSTGEWHQVVVEKVGKVVTLKVGDMNSTTTADGLWKDPSTVFNLDSERSAIYVAGIPKGVQLQKDIDDVNEYTGFIEDVRIGDIPISLWNAVNIKNVKGADPRDKPTKEANGARFDGSSFVMLPRGKHNIAQEAFINLRFKTYAEDGLLYFIGGDSNYLSLMLKRGTISLVFNNGETVKDIPSSKLYNDGNWHLVESSRSSEVGEMLLVVDRTEIGNVKHGKGIDLQTNNIVFIGGLPKDHTFADAVEANFMGCIKDFQIGTQMQSLLKAGQASPNVLNGCPDTSLREALFNASLNSYISLNTSINERADITLKFKTVELDGLLFFTSNDDHTSYLSVFLEDGDIVMKTKAGEVRTMTGKKYNDNHWHYISAKKDQQNLQLYADEIASPSAPLSSVSTASASTKSTFLGSAPNGYSFDFKMNSIPSVFTGCIGDVTVNEKFQNFAESVKINKVSFVGCTSVKLTNGFPMSTTTTPITTTSSTTTSTSTTTTTTEPEISKPVGECKLPLVPARDTDANVEDGVRFGNSAFSRYEFMVPASVTSKLLEESNFKIAFKTDGPISDGVLVFVVGSGNIDFVGLYMQAGKIIFSFNCGSGAAFIITDNTYNDSAWHTVVFNIRGRNGILRVISENNTEQKYGHSVGDTNSLNVKAPIYVGGLSEEATKVAKNKLKGVTQSFSGCIKDLHIQAEKYNFGDENVGYDAQPCSEKVEFGAYFHGNGFAAVYDDFRVGERIAFSFEVKPRNLTGVIMAVLGKVDFMILEMVENSVILTVNNGAGNFSSSLKLPEKHMLCDGQWHLIEGYKQSNMVTLNVDDIFSEPGWGVGGVYSTDTNGPLYIGGLPQNVTISELVGKPHFVGCIRKFVLSKKPQSLIDARVEGNVNLNTCSTI